MTHFEQILTKVKTASQTITDLPEETIQAVLLDFATALVAAEAEILAANQKDLKKMDANNLARPRVELTSDKIKNMARDIRAVAALPSPLHKTLDERTLYNGLTLSRVSVPFGVIGIMYEARPNVTADIFSLCLKTGNACVLKGGSDAAKSSTAIVAVIKKILGKHHLDSNIIHLITGGRAEAQKMMKAVKFIDVIIPRGSAELINYVRQNAHVPIIETGAGIVHTFMDESADVEMAARIIHNAKTNRPAVCNSLDTLIIHEKKLPDLGKIILPLVDSEVQIFADKKSFAVLKKKYPKKFIRQATPKHFGTEFLSLKMSVKTVASLDEALKHIATYSSKHSEAILSTDKKNIERFLAEVDAAVVYANTATVFTDGAEFGLGAEVGISTQKLHARGPMGLSALTSYKWIVRGDGQIRSK